MSNLIQKLEDILKKNIPHDEHSAINLSKHNCKYRTFYFDYLSEVSAREALLLFPLGEKLYEKYRKVVEHFKKQPERISEEYLLRIIKKYLSNSAKIMEPDEDKDAITFLSSIKEIKISEQYNDYGILGNELHKFVYGSISELLINEMPYDKAYWLIYDWSLEKTKSITVTAYLLEDYLDNEILKNDDFFFPAFELWRYGYGYCAKENSLKSDIVFCKPLN